MRYLINEDTINRLGAIARKKGVSISSLIAAAIDGIE